jgi:hypothetical protein
MRFFIDCERDMIRNGSRTLQTEESRPVGRGEGRGEQKQRGVADCCAPTRKTEEEEE